MSSIILIIILYVIKSKKSCPRIDFNEKSIGHTSVLVILERYEVCEKNCIVKTDINVILGFKSKCGRMLSRGSGRSCQRRRAGLRGWTPDLQQRHPWRPVLQRSVCRTAASIGETAILVELLQRCRLDRKLTSKSARSIPRGAWLCPMYLN
jgi:hypothetical protein